MQFEEEYKSIAQHFEEVISSEDKLQIKDFLDDQNISDIVELIDEYPEYDSQIIAGMSIHRAVNVFKLLELSAQKEIIAKLPPNKLAALLNELPADDRTDFLEELSGTAVRDLIKLLNPEERKITLSLLGYPENSIGRLMNPDYVYVYEHNTVAEVFEIIRKFGRNSDAINVIYVINENDELLDDLRIGEFILSTPDVKVSELMDDRVIALNAFDDQETANNIFKMNNRVALPVVNNNNKLLGIVTIDDVLWVAEEEFTEDIQKMGGLEALNEPYLETPFLQLIRKRSFWLVLLFIGEMLTATAMSFFEDEIAKAVVLALFIPLIISSGGNSGSQASTLVIQAMAVGEITIKDWWRILKREFYSGLFLGAILGCIGFLRITLFTFIFPNLYGPHWISIAFTIGVSLVGVVLWGSLIGSMFPIILKKFGLDPAVSSAPLVATLVDVMGIVIYFSIAFLFLHNLFNL
ncbi:MAG: magnesium transporter [Chitinophagaceae bacterium]|nr:MAG: magnesium transporter [Chitinophagaceae bacterium]